MGPPVDQNRAPPATLVLASASPRRKELLGRLEVPFEVAPADADETVHPGEVPTDYVLRVARAKAERVHTHRPEAIVLAADTSVVRDGEILGKPATPAEAAAMLRTLCGRAHHVLTAVVLRAPHGRHEQVVDTRVHFRPASSAELAWYAATGEPMDKAGGYAVQGIGAFLVERVEGSPTNVIGLPLVETLALLKAGGVRLPWEVGP